MSAQTRARGAHEAEVKIKIFKLNLYYGKLHALKGIELGILKNRITAVIGPSGCGKSSLLKVINRMVDLIIGAKVTGQVLLDGEDVYDENVDVAELRRRIGMVFQKPNPFAKSVFENVAYGPMIHGVKKRSLLEGIVERSLIRAALWDEVKDRLHRSALELSGGQQQRLCIARALATEPEVILMDEPCSALDPASTLKIEELMQGLAKDYTIVLVTHNMQQAARVADYTAFMLAGELIEYAPTGQIFTRPQDQRTEDYITGRFG